VDAEWVRALRRSPFLFDGPVLLADVIGENKLVLREANYRHVMALRADPALRRTLGLRPLAVSGVLSCREGVVLGQRGAEVSQDPGHWELVPSGGVTEPDLEAQILAELHEEIGLGADQVRVGKPIGLILDEDVLDIVIPLGCDLAAADIMACHAARGSPEYARLTVTPTPGDFAAGRADVAAATRALLASLG
jgi:hypothetical protein